MSPVTSERQPVSLKLLLGPFGAATYNLGFAMSDLARKSHPWLRLSPSETPGLIYNVKAVDNPSLWDNTIFSTGPDIIALAAKGDPIIGQQVTGIRGLFTYLAGSYHLVTLDPSIKSAADLKGKRIAVGLKTQIGWATEVVLTLEHGYGVTEKNSSIQYVGPAPAKNALMDGRVDAAVTGIYANPISNVHTAAPQLVELASGPRPVYHIPWGKTETEETVKKSGLPLIPVVFPAGSLPTIKQDLQTWVATAAFACKDTFPEEYAYEFVKMVHKERERLGEYEAQAKLISPEFLTFGWTTRTLHQGAVRALQEAGVRVPEK